MELNDLFIIPQNYKNIIRQMIDNFNEQNNGYRFTMITMLFEHQMEPGLNRPKNINISDDNWLALIALLNNFLMSSLKSDWNNMVNFYNENF